jgi:hypothetical protein
MISENFAKQFYWEELLEPHLKDYAVRFKDSILVSCIVPNVEYIAFISVTHTNEKVSSKQIPWFSDWVKLQIRFLDKEIMLNMSSVHLRKEIQLFSSGTILLDKRSEIFGAKEIPTIY